MSTIEKALAKRKKTNQRLDVEIQANNNSDIIEEQSELTSNPRKKIRPVIHTSKTITLNGEHLIDRGFIFSSNSAHHIQEEFRHIKRKLINNAFGNAAKTLKHSNLIMISSANPNEGKTFISINLALSIALEQDKTVLLIDADVLNPSLQIELEFDSKEGLLEYLLAKINSLSDVIYNTSIPNLKIIPAGKPHYLANELLASKRMEILAEELAQRYPDRLVIFDCPPILGVTETPVLSDLVGQAIIIVEESITKICDVKKAVSQLNKEIAIGCIMNKKTRSKKDGYGYYGYAKKT